MLLADVGARNRDMPSHYQGSETTVRALNAYINLMRACDSLERRLAGKLELRGLTVAQFGILEALLHLGPMCQKALGEKLLRSRGNITVVVNNLEKRGLVRRQRDTEDKRMIQIHLRAEGQKLIASVFPQHAEDIKAEMSVLNREEQEALRQLCRKLGKGAPGLCDERLHEQREGDKKNATSSTE